MTCPVCLTSGQIYSGPVVATTLGVFPYCEEDGTYHRHDPNTYSEEFGCPMGHRWRITWTAACPSCPYGADSEQTEILDDGGEE
jgi:hypothetical protein